MPDFVSIVIGMGVLVLVIWAANKFQKGRVSAMDAEEDAAKKRESDYQAFRDSLLAGTPLKPVSCDLLIGTDETAYFAQKGVKFLEVRPTTEMKHSGMAVNVGYGVSVAGGHTTSRDHDEWQSVCRGSLFVTDSRIIFNGENQNCILPLAGLLQVTADDTSVDISCEGREKFVSFADINGRIVRDLIIHLKGKCSR